MVCIYSYGQSLVSHSLVTRVLLLHSSYPCFVNNVIPTRFPTSLLNDHVDVTGILCKDFSTSIETYYHPPSLQSPSHLIVLLTRAQKSEHMCPFLLELFLTLIEYWTIMSSKIESKGLRCMQLFSTTTIFCFVGLMDGSWDHFIRWWC